LRNVADNTFLWHKDKKLYVSEFSTNALYIAVNLVQKHFKDHVFSDEINDILEGLSVYENMTWNPTLKKVDGRFYIVALNQSLYDAIADIELNDDPKTLMVLSNHGVVISDEVFDNDPFKIFAGNYFVEADLASLAQVSEWMKLLEVDHVFTANHMIYTKQITNDIKVHLLTDGITVSPAGSTDHKNGVLFKTTHTVPLRVNMRQISKIVHLVNSTPVDIR
jgi:hypothetical protein